MDKQTYQKRADVAQKLVWFCLAGLIVIFVLGSLIWVPAGKSPSVIILAIQSLPLLAFIPALRKKNLRAYAWLCFVLQLYFIVAVVNLFNPVIALLDVFETALIVVLFIAATLYIRWQARADKVGE